MTPAARVVSASGTAASLQHALVAGLVMAVLAGCGQSSSGPPSTALNTHVVTDSTGTAVTVPNSVTRIADAWPAHNEVVQMLGAGDKIVATVPTPASWLYTIDPALRQAQTVFTNTTVNAEALAQTHPDVLFADKST